MTETDFRRVRFENGVFAAECVHCFREERGLGLITHSCAGTDPDYWRKRYLIERRFSRRLQLILALCAAAPFVAALLRRCFS